MGRMSDGEHSPIVNTSKPNEHRWIRTKTKTKEKGKHEPNWPGAGWIFGGP